MSLVWARRIGSPSRKAVLMVMADVANSDGSGIWLSKKSIAARSEVSLPTVKRAMSDLVSAGLVKEVGKRKVANGFTTIYRIEIGTLRALEKSQSDTVQIDTGQNEPRSPRTPTRVTVNPHTGHSEPLTTLEPPINHPNTQTRADTPAPAGLNKALVDQAKAAWNAMADQSGLDPVQLITPDRLRLLNARLEDVGGDWSAVLQAINGVPHDPHRTGHTQGGWQANFDWVFKSAANFTKCLEAKPRQKKDNADDPKHERSRSYDTAARLALANMGVGAGNEIHGFRPVGQTCRVDGAGGGRKLLSGPDNRRLCGDGLA